MEKRALIAIVISFLILVGWSYLFPPAKPPVEPPPAETPAATAGEPVPGPVITEVAPEAPPEAPADEVQALEAAAEEEIVITNSLYEVTLSNRGGQARSWKLHAYTTSDGRSLELIPPYVEQSEYFLAVDLDTPELTAALHEALYTVERERIFADGERGPGEKVTFTWADGRGLQASKAFSFREGEYLVGVDLEVMDRGRRLPARLSLGPGFAAQDASEGRSRYAYNGQIVWNLGGEVTRLAKRKLEEAHEINGQLRWGGIEDQYFAALVLPSQEVPGRLAWRGLELTPSPEPQPGEEPEEAEAAAEPLVSVSVPAEGALLYIGPKKYKQLRATGHELEKVVWFSSQGWLRPIVKAIFLALIWIHDNIAANYGLAIILATVVLRLMLFPINQYSMVKMKKSQLQMQHLQPKIKSIKAKYKKSKDAQSRSKMNQETMELYKQEGINPMGGMAGCLPLFAQFPILIGFYNMLTVAVELRGAPFFGWIQDLSLKDPFWITPLLMGVTMFVQQRLSMSKIKDPQQLQQQRFMMFMPFMFTFICLQMPSGLVLYWFINNLLGIGQQWLVNRQTSKIEAPAGKA
jgi:YidC/Oxa1 family membrane protein insertase